MTKTRSTKSALISSVIALLLCFTMLLGTTFAWFTDSVTSANNVIKSGNLDIALDFWDGDSWETVEGTDSLFTNNLWEPGHTEVVYLKLSNLGSLALKYQLAISVLSETEGTNMAGDPFKLSDYIQMGVVEGVNGQDAPYATREAAVDAVKDASGIIGAGYAKQGNMLSGDPELYMAVVVYMPENVGNEANAKTGTDVPTINLGVQVLATQYTAESDGFDDQYDKGADYAIVVKDAAGLINAIETIEDGGIIALNADVTFDANTATNSGGSWYEGIYYTGDKSFTIDLGGKTITNDSAVNDYLMLFKNDGDKANIITLRNGTIEAGSSAYCALCTSSTSTQQITINLENVTLVGDNTNGSVAKIRGGAELNVKAGTVITGNDSYLGIESYNGIVNIYDGAEIYQKGSSSYNGSLVGVGGNGTVNVYGGYGEGASGGFIAMTSGGTINVYGGEWIANTDGTVAGDNNAVLIAQSDKTTYGGGNSVINVLGGVFAGGFNCYGNAVGDAQINISAGTFNTDPSAYVADGYQVVDNGDGTWTVKGYDVSNATELTDAIANGKAVELTQDISLGKIDLTDAITNDVVINANGHKITTTDAYGIEVTAGKNITISNADVVMTKEGDYITYAAGFKIANGDYAGTTITLSNCTITMANEDWAYAVNLPASVTNLNLVIDNCVLEGAVAVQCWGDNNTITITDSKLICNYTTNAMYTSHCVAMQADSYYAAENNTLVIENCEFKYSGVDNFNSKIYAVTNYNDSNTVTVTNCTYGEKVVAE